MTEHKCGGDLTLGGQRVHERLTREEPELIARVLARIQAEVADYRRLPVEELAGDIAGITRQAVRAFARSLREDRELNEAELRQVGASAVRRAEEGFPLEAVLTAYHVGAREIFAVGSAPSGSGDVADLLEVADRVLAFVGTVTGAVTRGYLEELRTKVGQEHTARRTLLSVLVDGGPVDVVARSAGITLPARYVVLSVELGPHADEESPGVDAEIAVRRKLRRFLAAFEGSCGDGVLASLDGPGGLVLLPVAGRVPDWDAVVAAAGRAAGVTVLAAAETAAPSEVREVAAQTGEVLDVLRWFGRPPGLYRLDDVLVEYQLTRPGAARDRLAAALDPLQAHPELVETLDAYLTLETNRRRTAAQLHVHPNTVDYRLRRIRDLTGIDPLHPAGLPRIIAASAARRATHP
ncbi:MULTISPECIES: helix-turn-helix domain-containing protein [unclassified Amycolatopsis]|uniref:PucR family transcriptional regulator n=1 Tax=unclassified Amycolatopsis TaxID=2618356 RepID=UPI002874EC3A|nr:MULTISPECIES: helix-turn-helix domain-containing protein [unclassified Amycolatopsis]MDS0135499.1 helix-turn-helix domain-containing protein [Amycolatopsis sp. 505]MDS0140810.1 helix-turn-helix domain-containing protein [Amycolatopsis sp. CM201R]